MLDFGGHDSHIVYLLLIMVTAYASTDAMLHAAILHDDPRRAAPPMSAEDRIIDIVAPASNLVCEARSTGLSSTGFWQ